MILKLYQSNSSAILIALPLVMLLFWAPNLITGADLIRLEYTTTLFNTFQIENILLNRITSFLIIFVTGVILTNTINQNELFEKSTFLPALLYVTIMSSMSEMQQMHPLLITHLFWAFAYRRLLNIYASVQCRSEIFDASLLILIGSLFSFPSTVILSLLPWGTLLIVRPPNFKEYIMPLLASGLILIYIITYQYIFNTTFELPISKSIVAEIASKTNWFIYVIYSLIIVVLYLSGFYLLRKSSTSSVRFRKLTTNLILFLALVVAMMILEKVQFNNSHFILYGAIPFSIIWSFYFFYSEKGWISNTLFYLSFVLLLTNLYFPAIFLV